MLLVIAVIIRGKKFNTCLYPKYTCLHVKLLYKCGENGNPALKCNPVHQVDNAQVRNPHIAK